MLEGDVIDERYRVDKKLGQGGMGQVFRGHDLVLNKTVAIKVLFPNTPDLVIKRFHAEAVALGQLQHPNILSVQQFGQSENGVLYLVTDYIHGESLSTMIENRGAQTFFDVLPIFERICRGLRYAHANKVLHRDIKPSNVMLATDRSRDDSVKLVDFGLAKQGDKDFYLTKTGSAIGTPAYMSPETIHGKDVDERSDIYQLGCTFFEMMAGRLPFVEEAALETLSAHLNRLPPTLAEASGKDFEPEVEEFVQRCLKKDPNERFQNMDELIEELTSVKERLLENNESGNSVASGIYASGLLLATKMKRADRSMLVLLLVILGGVSVIAGGVLMWWHPTPPTITQSPQTEKEISELAIDAQKIQRQEDLQNMEVDGVRSGALTETGPDGELWCRVFGKLTDEQLKERLKEYRDIPNYSLENLTVSAEALDEILSLPIEKLILTDLNLTDDVVQRIARMKKLTWLSTTRCDPLPANFLKHLKNSHLTTLIMALDKNQSRLGSELASLKTLQKISLLRARIQRSDVRSIVNELKLMSLTLSACDVAQDAFVDLKLAKNCIAFTATNMKLTTQQFEDISKIPFLTYLNLSDTNLDDKTLKSFRHCTNLQRVILINTSVTPTGFAVLKASVPRVNATLAAPKEEYPF